MRVLMIPQTPHFLYYGGAEVQAEKTALALNQRGHAVTGLQMWEKEIFPDIVHFYGLTTPEWVISVSDKCPVVLSPIYYRPFLKSLIRAKVLNKMPGSLVKLQRNAMLLCRAILPNSKAEAKQISSHYDIDNSKISVVPNGVEKEMIGDDPEGFRATYRVFPNHDKYILSIQRIESRKRTLDLITAAINLETPLMIIGQLNKTAKEAEYIKKVLELASKAPKLVRIEEALSREVLKNAYASAYVHALPSILETPGLASLEAAINGCNLVVGDCPPVREYFETIAHFCQPKKIESLIYALNEALNLPRNSRSQKEHVLSLYTWEKVAALTEQVYLNVVGREKI